MTNWAQRHRRFTAVTTSVNYKQTLDAHDKPLDPRVALELNSASGQGSCVAGVKRSQALDKTPDAMLSEAKGANCDGVLSVQLKPGITPYRVGNAEFTLVGFKRIISARRSMAMPWRRKRTSGSTRRRLEPRRSCKTSPFCPHHPRRRVIQ